MFSLLVLALLLSEGTPIFMLLFCCAGVGCGGDYDGGEAMGNEGLWRVPAGLRSVWRRTGGAGGGGGQSRWWMVRGAHAGDGEGGRQRR